MDEEDEHFLSASHQKCILLSGTECHIINYLLTECEGRTGEYWPEVVTETTEGQYSRVRPEQAQLVSSLLYGTLFLIVKCTSGDLHLKNVRLLHPSLKFQKKFNLFSLCW